MCVYIDVCPADCVCAVHTVKNVLFGKSCRTIEYPSGQMRVVSIRMPTKRALLSRIAMANGLESAGACA